jgi:hypothetical protein
MMKNFILSIWLVNFLYASSCIEYFNPENFNESPEYLQELLEETKNYDKNQELDIIKKEIYKLSASEVANNINNDFEEYWSDWVGDGYELYLKPEYTLFKYKEFYFSLKVIISGVIGDATKLKGTVVKYHFYNYNKEVNKHIKCKDENK